MARAPRCRRGYQKDGSTADAVNNTKEKFRIYPLSKKGNPPKMKFVNASGKFMNTIHRMDEKIFDEIDDVIQAEPLMGERPELLVPDLNGVGPRRHIGDRERASQVGHGEIRMREHPHVRENPRMDVGGHAERPRGKACTRCAGTFAYSSYPNKTNERRGSNTAPD